MIKHFLCSQVVENIGSGRILVTGGTGALGTTVAGWLISQGVKRTLLVNRSGHMPLIAALMVAGQAFSAEMTVCMADMSQLEDVAAVLAQSDVKVRAATYKRRICLSHQEKIRSFAALH